MKFLAQLQQMAASEILNIVPSEIYREIKEKDPTPVFRAYVVGHEGEATGKKVGAGTVIKNWFSSAVNKLVEKLQFGTKVFHGHGLTNEHEGRIPIGEIVGKAVKKIKDRLSAIAVTYIYPEYRSLPLDVASIEADINIDPTRDSIEAVDVAGVTGVALGSSAVEKPGFAGATLLSQIQAFANGQSQFTKGGEQMPTLDEIRKFVSEEAISPSEIFGRDVLVDDPVVKGFVDEAKKIASSGEYAHRKRTDEAFDKARKEWEEKEKKYQEQLNQLKVETAKVKAADLFGNKIKERKLDKLQAEYIKAKQKVFTPKDVENLEKEIDEFLDSTLEDYKETAKIFGKDVDTKTDKKGGGEPSGEGSGEENELIPD